LNFNLEKHWNSKHKTDDNIINPYKLNKTSNKKDTIQLLAQPDLE
jgi:hypothetical protein